MFRNAFQSAKQAFGRIWGGPAGQLAALVRRSVQPRIREADYRVRPIVRRAAMTLPPMAALEATRKAIPRISPIATPAYQAMKNVALDLPFYTARARREIGRRVLPHTLVRTGLPSPPRPAKGPPGIIPNLFPSPIKSASAEVQPFLTYPKLSPKHAALKEEVIRTSGFRPAAQAYFRTVPMSTTRKGIGPLGVAYPSIINPGIAIREEMPEGVDPRHTILHELMHVVPPGARGTDRSGYNPYQDFLQAFEQVPSLRGIMTSYSGPKTTSFGPPGYPGPEESFANIGQYLGQGTTTAPIVKKYYEAVFEMGTAPVKIPSYQRPLPQTLKDQEEEEKRWRQWKKGK